MGEVEVHALRTVELEIRERGFIALVARTATQSGVTAK